ncbi:hypothetical protein Mapa_005205 [Marchantia paleacea]|nr:hypothetical protein Mapa_005205 [Marchantia paleacea]
MSFSRTNVSESFHKFQNIVLWFQMAYILWQFVRTTKYFRLPYVMVSSLWHGFDSWLKKRNLIMMKDDIDVDYDPSVSDVLASEDMPPGMTIAAIADSPNVQLSFDPDDPYIYLTTRSRASHMKRIRAFNYSCRNNKSLPLKFGKDDDLLWPKAHLVRRLSFVDAICHVLHGKGYYIEPAMKCFFDYTTKEFVNQNSMRFVSTWPLILQARNYEFWSVMLSIAIVLIDLLSYFANRIWRFTQYWVSRLVKRLVYQIPDRETRTFWYAFMATISSRFECRNFVTSEASSKEVKEVLVATHIRLDKERIASLRPIECGIEVPRKKEVGAGTTQRIRFKLDGISYSGLAQPALTHAEVSSVLFQAPEDVKVANWSVADMAYFLQVCDFCDKFKFSPIKAVEGNDGLCSSFAEIVHGNSM